MKKYLFGIILVLFTAWVFAFNVKDLTDAEVLETSPCWGHFCIIAEKDGQRYLVIGDVVGDTFYPMMVWSVDKQPKKLWDKNWKET